jgi:hypothetical protein
LTYLKNYYNCLWKGLILGGGDVGTTGISGDMQGGWVAANAALGKYDPFHLFSIILHDIIALYF